MDPLGIGIRCNELGVFGFDRPQFPGQGVELVVLDFRRILVVIFPAVIIDDVPQFLYAGTAPSENPLFDPSFLCCVSIE